MKPTPVSVPVENGLYDFPAKKCKHHGSKFKLALIKITFDDSSEGLNIYYANTCTVCMEIDRGRRNK